VAAIVLRTVEINHLETPPGLVCPGPRWICAKEVLPLRAVN
jgi:hypothetical protein